MNLLDVLPYALFVVVWIAVPGAIIYFAFRRRANLFGWFSTILGFARETLTDITQKNPHMKLTEPHRDIIDDPESKNKIPHQEMIMNRGVLPVGDDLASFKHSYDEDYENAINVTALETTHAKEIGLKQLDIQALKEQRKIKMTGN